MIHRHRRTDNFVVKDTHAARNRDLSWQAKGVHDFLMQLPPDFKVTIEGLVAYSPDGRTCCRSAINELVQAGYVVRTQKKGEGGKFGEYEYHVFERPEYAEDFDVTDVRFSDVGLTDVGFSDVGKPDTIKVLSVLKIKGLKSEEEGVANAREKNETGSAPVKPLTGQAAAPAPFTIFNTQGALDALPADQPTLEAFVRRTGLKSAEYGAFCADFKVHCTALGQDYPKRADLIRHFLNWADAKATYAAKAVLPPTPRQNRRPGTVPVSTNYDSSKQSFRP